MRGPVIFLRRTQASALQSLADANGTRVRRPTLEALARHGLATLDARVTEAGRRWLAESNDDRHETRRLNAVELLARLARDPTADVSEQELETIDDELHVVFTPTGWRLTQRGRAVDSLAELHRGRAASSIGDWDRTGFTPWGTAVHVLARLERGGFEWRMTERDDLLTFDGRPWGVGGAQPWLELRHHGALRESLTIEVVEESMVETTDELRLILDDAGVEVAWDEEREGDHAAASLGMARWDDGIFHSHVSHLCELIVGVGLELFGNGRGLRVHHAPSLTAWRGSRGPTDRGHFGPQRA